MRSVSKNVGVTLLVIVSVPRKPEASSWPSGKTVRENPPPTGKLDAIVAPATPGTDAARSAAAR